jgi:hypothetical protein
MKQPGQGARGGDAAQRVDETRAGPVEADLQQPAAGGGAGPAHQPAAGAGRAAAGAGGPEAAAVALRRLLNLSVTQDSKMLAGSHQNC